MRLRGDGKPIDYNSMKLQRPGDAFALITIPNITPTFLLLRIILSILGARFGVCRLIVMLIVGFVIDLMRQRSPRNDPQLG